MWNVDDRRVNDSVEKQSELFDHSKDCAIVYRDYFRADEYGFEKGEFVKTPEFSRRYFSRSISQGGSFYMWRKGICKQTGFFDVQFITGPDFDFSVRAVLTNQKFCRVNATMGYFTSEKSGISTRDGGHLSSIERTVIQLRYGIFDKIRPQYIKDAKEYNILQIMNFGNWRPLADYIPSYEKYLSKKIY